MPGRPPSSRDTGKLLVGHYRLSEAGDSECWFNVYHDGNGTQFQGSRFRQPPPWTMHWAGFRARYRIHVKVK